MASRIFRFYSGFYDSVKQRVVYFDFRNAGKIDPSSALKQEYLWRLRYDIVYRGSVVLTDAQFFDGLFFHLLNGEERSDLQSFMTKRLRGHYPLIEVRGRGESVDETLLKMFSKPFTFSSLRFDQHQRSVYNAMGSLDREEYSNWREILKAVSDGIRLDELEQTSDNIVLLREIIEQSKSLRPWGPSEWFKEKWSEGVPPLLREVMRRIIDEGGSGDEKEADVKNQPFMQFLVVVRDNLKRDFPSRSEVDEVYRAAHKISNELLPEQRAVLDTVSEQFWHLYNSAIAFQHGAGDIDVGESEDDDVLNKKTPTISSQWDRFGLDNIPWKDFWEIMIESTEWAAWLEYRFSPSDFDETEIRRREQKLFTFLNRRFPSRSSKGAIWGGGSDMFKHRIKGFLSSLPTYAKKLFSQVEFSLSMSSGEPLNPTITATLKSKNRK